MNRNRKIADKYIATKVVEDMKRRKEERKKERAKAEKKDD